MDQPKPKRKATAGSFKAGQSGNPGGRPKEVGHVKELAKSFTEEAIQTLAQIMRSEDQPAAARVKASECLLDRAWGKSESHATVTVNKDVRDLSTAEILAALAATGIVGAQGSSDSAGAVH